MIENIWWSDDGVAHLALALVVAVGAVALATSVVWLLKAGTPIDDDGFIVIYLVPILVVALVYGALPSVAAAILAVLVIDAFFIDPVGRLLPLDPDAWTELLVFLVVGLITGELASRLRHHARATARREREAHILYALSSELVKSDEPADYLPGVYRAIASDLGIIGMALFDRRDNATPNLVAVAGRGKPARAVDLAWIEQLLEAPPASVLGRSGEPPERESIERVPTHLPMRENTPSGSAVRARGADAFAPSVDYLPISVGERVEAVLAIELAATTAMTTISDDNHRRIFGALVQHLGLSLRRRQLRAELTEVTAARRADEMKEVVLRAVTHDLRTPLAVIRASAVNLRPGDPSWTPEQRERFVSIIENNVDRLDRLVGNLLQLSRLDAGSFPLDRAIYPIDDLVYDVISRLEPLLADHPLSIEVADGVPPVSIDYGAIERVLSNLVENAVRHTPAGTSIAIRVEAVADRVAVAVSDTAGGIAPDELPRVFDRFYRGRSRRADASPGAGLGLAVARGLIEAHGGAIEVRSDCESGTCFTFYLPAETPATALVSAR